MPNPKRRRCKKSTSCLFSCIYIFLVVVEGRRYLKKRYRVKNETITDFDWFSDDVELQSSRIVGGSTVTSVNKYPFMASVQMSFPVHGFRHVCGGTLIAPDVVLSAAHCAPKAFQVQLQSLNSRMGIDFSKIYRIVEIRIHPRYNPENFDFDFALFKLERNAQNVGIIKLSSDDSIGLDWMKVAGWGTTENIGGNLSARLKETNVHYVANQRCEKSYGSKNLVSDNMICAVGFNTDNCIGDSGGPLLKYVTETQQGVASAGYWEQVGVISWGYGECANNKYPGVYAKVFSAIPWIDYQICNLMAGISPSSCENGALPKTKQTKGQTKNIPRPPKLSTQTVVNYITLPPTKVTKKSARKRKRKIHV